MDNMMKKAKEYSLLVGDIADKDVELKKLKSRRDELQEELLEWFTEADGPDKISIEGRTLFPRREVWVSVNGIKGIEALKKHGFGDMVKETVSTQTLSSWYRELEKEQSIIPEWLSEAVNVAEKYKMSARKENR